MADIMQDERGRSLNIVLICGFFDSTIESFRENQFAYRLAERGHKVRIITSTASIRWRWNRAGAATNNPSENDARYTNNPNVTLIRRKPLLRIGDLVLFRLRRSDLKDADVVHVLDFRQGITAFAARLASSAGIKVIYDHEQRGDRSGSPLHTLDNRVRRAFIRYGARAPSLVRHTVTSNRVYFEETAPRYSGPFALSPLGADEKIFHVDADLRAQKRADLGLLPSDFMWLMSGKIELEKRVDEVARALAHHDKTLFLVGDISEQVRPLVHGQPNIRYLGKLPQRDMAALYNAADCSIFTTFTLSYWEALACGAHILVPSTNFSDNYLGGRVEVSRFGEPGMFEVEEERYRTETKIEPYIAALVPTIENGTRQRQSPTWLSWPRRIDELEAQYRGTLSV